MARRGPSVRWNESKQRWMAWVRFPDGSRRKVERASRAEAERDLDTLLSERDTARSPRPRRERLVTFNEVLDGWVAAGCPNVAVDKRSRRAKPKSENTLDKIGYLLDGHVRPPLGNLRVERTDTERVAAVFHAMAEAGYATSTIDHTWSYLNQACVYGVRTGRITVNPAADVLLPAARPSRTRKSFTIDQVRKLLLEAIPTDPRPAQWVTGLMCGLRPGELAGLRRIHVDVDSDDPHILVAERTKEVRKRYAGQAPPKTARKAGIGLHPVVVAALRQHRAELGMLGLYDREGFVFGTRNGTPQSVGNIRRAFKRLCTRASLDGDEWTTYELRHSFVSLVSDALDDLMKVADLAGHANLRTTEGYRHAVHVSLPHAVTAWDSLLGRADSRPDIEQASSGWPVRSRVQAARRPASGEVDGRGSRTGPRVVPPYDNRQPAPLVLTRKFKLGTAPHWGRRPVGRAS